MILFASLLSVISIYKIVEHSYINVADVVAPDNIADCELIPAINGLSDSEHDLARFGGWSTRSLGTIVI